MPGTVPAAAQPHPIVSPTGRIEFVEDDKTLTQVGQQVVQQMHDYVVNMNRIIPCNATGTNVITLTMLAVQPFVDQYNDYETYAFVAANTTTGVVTALVVTADGTLATLKVFKTNGSAQATTGDIVSGLQYFATYVDSLDSGSGGFVLR